MDTKPFKKRLLTLVTRALAAWALGTMMIGAACAQEAVGAGLLTGALKKIKDAGVITIGHRDASIPFSFLSPARQPIGYSIDLCLAIVEELKAELGLANLEVKYFPVNPQTRIPLVVNGTVDLECGSTTNNAERRREVAFSPIIFVSGTKLLAKRSANLKSYRQFKGRTVVVTEGTTNETAIKQLNAKDNLGMKIVVARDHDQSFQMLEAGQADAWASDDVLLYGMLLRAKNPRDYVVLGDYLSYDPYGIMYRKDDAALRSVVERTFEQLAASREIEVIYDQWFRRKLSGGRALGIPMSAQLRSVFESLGLPSGAETSGE